MTDDILLSYFHLDCDINKREAFSILVEQFVFPAGPPLNGYFLFPIKMSLSSLRLSSLIKSVVWGEENNTDSSKKRDVSPSIKLCTDKEVYRPGEAVTVSIEIFNPRQEGDGQEEGNGICLLVDGLSFEVKGLEKVDSQWYATQRPIPGSKEKRGNSTF